MSRPHACYLMSHALERMLWKFRGSSRLHVVYMTTTEYEGGKFLKFVSSLTLLQNAILRLEVFTVSTSNEVSLGYRMCLS